MTSDKSKRILFASIAVLPITTVVTPALASPLRSESQQAVAQLATNDAAGPSARELGLCLASSRGCSVTLIGTAPITVHGVGC